ncbi:MAG: carbohydrate binding family 9 domain-containing protein [Bacteroidetes bacterium]|nr:carbohydrate binding family 9 domain-containing protein [Bacteroidota bacterium]
MLNNTGLMLLAGSIFLCTTIHATDPPKKLQAQRITTAVKIDGNLDDAAWKTAPVADSFVEWRPSFGPIETHQHRTEIFIVYDNNAIYVAGYCHEKTADSVSRELAGRDKIGSNDYVGIIFDTYNDKINASGFYVTPLGEQYDAKYSNTNGEDDSWNAVWQSEAKIVSDGWTFELKIPYAALRFSSKVTDWGLNITRRRQKAGKQYMWNPVNPTVNGFINQEGLWTGLNNIKPPVRLSFSPYLSTYVNHYPKADPHFEASVNGGMDVKYGISPSYTLDMTLIPDFGQVASDKTILNLSPFEVKLAENRPFFTEGTELFFKGNLFYSRRIGGQPIHYYDVYGDPRVSKVIENPTQSKLYNATKISGRNPKGLGIGVLNAIARPMYAEVEDATSHNKFKIRTSSLTNYNVLVFDQTLKNNSSVSLVNTNVWRSGDDYDANVTAAVFDLNNKKNSYNINGKFAVSDITNKPSKDITGYSHTLSFGKTGGRFNFNVTEDLSDKKFSSQDMGYFTNADYLDHYTWFGYKWVKPGKWYNNLYFNVNNTLSHRFSDGAFQNYYLNINLNGQLRNLWYAGFALNYNPEGNDFYEPRVAGRVFKKPAGIGPEIWFSTNSTKKYYFSFDGSVVKRNLFNGVSYFLYFENRYRFNDKFSLSLVVNPSPYHNSAGFADVTSNGTIIFSRRDIRTFDNSLSGKYNFTKKAGFTVSVRHYWSEVTCRQFFTLEADGKLTENNTYTDPGKTRDYSLNLFNVDLVYSWQFAPGSFMYIVWKNAIQNFNHDRNYIKNLNSTLGTAQNNNLSLKLIYYLDYLSLRKKA